MADTETDLKQRVLAITQELEKGNFDALNATAAIMLEVEKNLPKPQPVSGDMEEQRLHIRNCIGSFQRSEITADDLADAIVQLFQSNLTQFKERADKIIEDLSIAKTGIHAAESALTRKDGALVGKARLQLSVSAEYIGKAAEAIRKI